MELFFKGKKPKKDILENNVKNIALNKVISSKSDNSLFFGENIIILKKLIYDFNLKGKIDLIYIDPPFSTNNTFHVSDERATTISHSKEDNLAYSDNLIGDEFLEFIRERLILLRELLSDEGSIYLHIDYKIGHYIKIIMDEVFGKDNFRNDITRIKCNPKNFKRKAYGNIKDLILFYTKTNNYIWNDQKAPYSSNDLERLFPKEDSYGKYTTIPLHAPGETKNGETSMLFKGLAPPKGRHWRVSVKELDKWDSEGLIEWSKNGNPRKKMYAENRDGKKLQDIWEFKDTHKAVYPTEKPSSLLDLIILNSSNNNSFVLDCFAGSGTTLFSASKNNRKWIGIDSSPESIKVIKNKLEKLKNDLFIENESYNIFEIK